MRDVSDKSCKENQDQKACTSSFSHPDDVYLVGVQYTTYFTHTHTHTHRLLDRTQRLCLNKTHLFYVPPSVYFLHCFHSPITSPQLCYTWISSAVFSTTLSTFVSCNRIQASSPQLVWVTSRPWNCILISDPSLWPQMSLTRNRLKIQISNTELLCGYLSHLQLSILKRGRKIFQYAGSTGRVLCCWLYRCDVTELEIRHGRGWRPSRSAAM